MWISASNARIAVSAQRALRLRCAEGASVRAVEGAVWITVDHDRRDIVLRPGDVFTIDSSGDVMVLPIAGDSARLAICAAVSDDVDGFRSGRTVADTGRGRGVWSGRWRWPSFLRRPVPAVTAASGS